MRAESLTVCPSDGRGGAHHFVRCHPKAPVWAWSCSHCGAAIERESRRYVASAEAAAVREAPHAD